MNWIEWCRVGAALLVLLAALRFCYLYDKKTKGDWRNNPFGVHMMTFSGSFVGYMVYAILTLVIVPDWLRPYFGTVILLSLAALFCWRTRLLQHAQREPIKERDDAAE